MPKLNDQLLIKLQKKKIRGRIIGIDQYQLENFEGTNHSWISYTLTSNKGGLFKRYWITDWKKAGWFVWMSCKRAKNLQKMKIVETRSGIAKIAFSVDQGASTPMAALAVYSPKAGIYYAMERFANSDVMFFRAQKISKPTIIKSHLA